MPHRCLLIEDDFSVARALRMLLDEAHIDWVHVTNYEDAVCLLTDPQEHFCIIVCDLGIPPEKGVAKPDPELGVHLIKRARELFPGKNPEHERAHYLPIIILSSAGTHTFRRAMQAGATDNLSKPLGVDALDFPDTMRLWLKRANREDHATCGQSDELARHASVKAAQAAPAAGARAKAAPPPASSPLPSSTPGGRPAQEVSRTSQIKERRYVQLSIPGKDYGQAADVMVDGTTARIQHSVLAGLMRLIADRLAERPLTAHVDLGTTVKESWKGKSLLEKAFKDVLAGRELAENVRTRGYRLHDDVRLGELNVAAFATGEGSALAAAAREIAKRQQRPAAETEQVAEKAPRRRSPKEG